MSQNKILYFNIFEFDGFEYFIGVTNKGLAYFERLTIFDNKEDFLLVRSADKTNSYILEIVRYFKKEITIFNFTLDLIGTEFQKTVWNELLKINYGTTLSYSEVASNMADINKTRAVANAIGKNNILIVVPCHRVLGKNLKLTGFSSGLDLKEYILDLENINYYEK